MTVQVHVIGGRVGDGGLRYDRFDQRRCRSVYGRMMVQ
jgi:hypothetical protein